MEELILGSASPRRAEILHYFSLPFRILSSDFDEDLVPFRGDPGNYVSEIAERKALSLRDRHPATPILTADTTVYKSGRIFAKPATLQEAHDMLKELQGEPHSVFTGVCVCRGSERHTAAEESRVYFHQLTDAQIHQYHLHFPPLDKAGAYAIQKGGSVIVKRIEGCYYNIMGLPLNTTRQLLAKLGIDLWDHLRSL